MNQSSDLEFRINNRSRAGNCKRFLLSTGVAEAFWHMSTVLEYRWSWRVKKKDRCSRIVAVQVSSCAVEALVFREVWIHKYSGTGLLGHFDPPSIAIDPLVGEWEDGNSCTAFTRTRHRSSSLNSTSICIVSWGWRRWLGFRGSSLTLD